MYYSKGEKMKRVLLLILVSIIFVGCGKSQVSPEIEAKRESREMARKEREGKNRELSLKNQEKQNEKQEKSLKQLLKQ